MEKTSYSGKDLGARFEDVSERVLVAAARAKRDPAAIKLIAISKTHPPKALQEALQAGITDLGENRVQEAESKITKVGRYAARWHLVGHLQANKVRKAVRLFDVVHSIDSLQLAERLDRICKEENIASLDALIQVDLGREATKTGVSETELPTLVSTFRHLKYLRLIGLMTLPPFFEEPEKTRPYFQRLRQLRDDLGEESFAGTQGELSMGMTNDFEVAIEEGATMLRIGTAIFGERTVAE